MNAREGMRRVGILLGALGSIAGAFLGYADMRDIWAAHDKFDLAVSAPVEQDIRKEIRKSVLTQSRLDKFISMKKATEGLPPLPSGYQLDVNPREFDVAAARKGGYSDDEIANYLAGTRGFDLDGAIAAGESTADIVAYLAGPNIRSILDGIAVPQTVKAEAWDAFYARYSPEELRSKLDTMQLPDEAKTALWNARFHERVIDVTEVEGITRVRTTIDGSIASVQLSNGEWVTRESRTFRAHVHLWIRLFAGFIYPILGFLLPWSSVRMLVWAGSGFSEPKGSV